jgi:hypothetical protein
MNETEPLSGLKVLHFESLSHKSDPFYEVFTNVEIRTHHDPLDLDPLSFTSHNTAFA